MALGACNAPDDVPAPSVLRPTDFRDPTVADATVQRTSKRAGVKMTPAERAAEGFLDLTTLPGPPAFAKDAPAAEPVGAPITLDQYIGQINGRSLFASEFFDEGFAARLAALPRQEDLEGRPGAVRAEAARLIQEKLIRSVFEDLMLDEVYASLEPEVRQIGIRAFMENVRQELARQNEGSQQLADQRMRDESGQTLDEFVKDRKNLVLIRLYTEKKVDNRVNVSYREVQNEYERRRDEIANQRTVFLRLISVPSRDQARVQAVTQALASGRSFEEVASSDLNTFLPSEGGLHVAKFTGQPDERLFGPEPLNAAAATLQPGQVAGPVEHGPGAWWIFVEREERPKIASLYDSQIDLFNELRAERTRDEHMRLRTELISRASVTPLGEMIGKLVTIADERYLNPESPRASAQ